MSWTIVRNRNKNPSNKMHHVLNNDDVALVVIGLYEGAMNFRKQARDEPTRFLMATDMEDVLRRQFPDQVLLLAATHLKRWARRLGYHGTTTEPAVLLSHIQAREPTAEFPVFFHDLETVVW